MPTARFLIQIDRPGTALACTKTRNFEAPELPATDPENMQHLIFSPLGLKFLIHHFKKLMYPNTSVSQITR